jgi:hypothetical protein
MIYPKTDYMDAQPGEFTVSYLSKLLEDERAYSRRVFGYWQAAEKRIKELKK